MTSDPQLPPDDDYQQWIDGLLRTSAAEAATPETLPKRIKTSIRDYRRRMLIWKSTAVLTAAAASIALIAIFQQEHPPVNVDRQVVSLPTDSPPTNSNPAINSPQPKATFTPRSDLLAVPLESNDPQVTIIQIYPTTHTHRRRQRQATLQAINEQINSLNQYATNGG